jgi:predicted nucleic acid-binding Zn ribbon protein
VDIAAAALADAQRIARANPRRRSAAGRRLRRENLAGRNGTDQSVTERTVTERNVGGYSGPARDLGADPHPIGELVAGYVEERGWQRPLAEARVFAEWPALVGADVAAHCVPAALRDGELRIAAESTAWATQLRLLSATLLARLVAELGADVVTKLVVTGPTAPSWRHGAFTVRGARGPRDTYG